MGRSLDQTRSVARVIGLSTKMHNKKNTMFLAVLNQSFAVACTPNLFFKHLLNHLFRGRGLICQKLNLQISKNFEKMAKTMYATKYDRLWLNIWFQKKT